MPILAFFDDFVEQRLNDKLIHLSFKSHRGTHAESMSEVICHRVYETDQTAITMFFKAHKTIKH